MTKQEIIDYVMHTPQNSNPAILDSILDSYSGAAGPSVANLHLLADPSTESGYALQEDYNFIKAQFDKDPNTIWHLDIPNSGLPSDYMKTAYNDPDLTYRTIQDGETNSFFIVFLKNTETICVRIVIAEFSKEIVTLVQTYHFAQDT